MRVGVSDDRFSPAVTKDRHLDLDMLKGLAVIAVILYHAGWCKSGYLGVDVFFVVSGFLVVPKVVREIENCTFSYLRFVEKRIFRLLPLVLVVCGVALAISYSQMLPVDLRYLSEEVIASSLFGNNLLQAVTTQNYWAAIYHKVLMHNWYLGVLFQFYLFFPLVMLLFKKRMRLVLFSLSLLSLLLYLLPIDTIGNKYYLLQYRFFELAAGGLIGLKQPKSSVGMSYAPYILFALMTLLVFGGAFTIGESRMPYNLVSGTNTIRESFLPRELLLLLTTTCTLSFLRCSNGHSISNCAIIRRVLAPLGNMSLSLFLWHQPLFAFYRYFYADQLSVSAFIAIVFVMWLLSLVSYSWIENNIRPSRGSWVCLFVVFLIVNGTACYVYRMDGLVKDVPELDMYVGRSAPEDLERYTDRIYQYDCDFNMGDKRKKILVIGNSFARDFANMLLESSKADSIQLSYHFGIEDCPVGRIRHCDRVYFFGWKHQVPPAVWANLKAGADVWGIGTKNHGSSNGVFFKNRCNEDYLSQRARILQDFISVNSLLQREWQDCYIDLLSMTIAPDGTVPVFTPDGKFITYDGLHLTPSGARFYASLLKFD